jgi:UDP-2,3-diacylglucosamine pyrophosphatase LpxH
VVVKYNKWLVTLGDYAYDAALWMNAGINRARSMIGKDYWSLSQSLKHKVKDAVKYIGAYENCLLKAAGNNGVDGIICGHIHRPAMRRIGDISYFNTGDWVETCSALVEHEDGTFEILRWYGPEADGIPVITAEGELVFRREEIVESVPM